jgi:hypothetical protein
MLGQNILKESIFALGFNVAFKGDTHGGLVGKIQSIGVGFFQFVVLGRGDLELLFWGR